MESRATVEGSDLKKDRPPEATNPLSTTVLDWVAIYRSDSGKKRKQLACLIGHLPSASKSAQTKRQEGQDRVLVVQAGN